MKGLLKRYIQFTKVDTVHATLGVIPAFLLVAFGHITVGVAFAIGLLPTSLLGFAPLRRMRIVFGIVGCLFGVGIFAGALLIDTHNIVETSVLFVVICFVATLVASKRTAGGLLLNTLIPSLGIGTGFAVSSAFGLMLAFMAGSIWSSMVMWPWPEFTRDGDVKPKLLALQPAHVKTYGLLLGLTAATAIFVGHSFDIPYPGWIATAAMLVIRPIQDMTGVRGVGRAITTIAGTLLVILTIHLSLGHLATAIVVAAIAIMTIGAKTSRLYVTPFGTAFLILTIELYHVADKASAKEVGHHRITNNLIGIAIALFYGLLVSWLLERYYGRRRRAGQAVGAA